MRINEFSIRRYDRLRDTGVVSLDKNFTLIYSRHGEGKTLTIDSIIKMLFGKGERGAFKERINRVEEEPDGYLELELEDGHTIKVPDQGRISAMNNELKSSDFRNVFVIHSSDLLLDEESPYYGSVSERISGIRTHEISNIKQAVKVVYYLTDKGQYRSTQGEDNYLRKRVEDSSDLLDRIDDLKEEIEEKSFEDYELKARQIQGEIDEIKKAREQFDQARKRKNYEKGSGALSSIKEKSNELQEFECIDQDDLERLRTREGKKKESKESIDSTEKELKRLRQKCDQEKENQNKLRRELENLRKTDEKIGDDLKPGIKNLEESRKDFASRSEMAEIIRPASWLFAELLAITVLGAVFYPTFPTFLFSLLVFIFFLSTAFLWGLRFYHRERKGKLERDLEEIKQIASKLALAGKTLEEINSSIKEFRDSLNIKDGEERDSSDTVISLGAKIEEKEEDLRKAQDAIKSAEKAIEEIKDRSGATNLEDYEKKYEQMDWLEREINTHKETLNALFGTEIVKRPEVAPEDFLDADVKEIENKLSEVYDPEYIDALERTEAEGKSRKTVLSAISRRKKDRLEKLLQYWEREITNLSKYEDKAKDIEYDEDQYEKIKKDLDAREKDRDDLIKKMNPIQEALGEIGEEANRIIDLRGDEKLPCETSVDLREIEKWVKKFKKGKKRDRDNALEILDIFKEIEKEERQEIPQVLEEASDYFSRFTQERYKKVKWEPIEKELRIKEKGKKGFRNAETLSVGERDQLYLSVRLALSNKILRGEKGFFILDDPLVSLHPEPLKIVLDTFKEISKAGWQIIYFTAKGEINEELTPDIDSGLVQRVPVAGVK